MIRNYLKIAFRNLRKNKIFSVINIVGLAIGLTCFMLITVFVYDELSYDKYADEADNIYRINLSATGNGDVAVYPNVDVAVGEGMKNAFPEIKASTRISPASDFVKYNDKQFKEQKLAFADSNFLQMFSIPLIEGDNKTALVQPNSVVISKAFAKKYFGNEDALGKSLTIGLHNALYKVTGVIDKVPDNTHFHFDAFLSLTTFHITRATWSNVGFYTYLLLNKNANAKALEAKFPQLVAKYVVPEVQHDMGVSLAEAQKSVNTFRFSLQPVTDIHLHANTKYELEPNGDIQYVYIFSALAIFILLLACVNFTNLSTARAVKRSREVGIRKVMGSIKKQLIFQFLTESVLFTFFSMLCAYALIFFLLPYFNELSNKNIDFIFFLSWQSILVLFSVSFIAGILAGIYPAFFLSSFNTIKVLKGASLQGSQRKPLRSSLIVFQFFISTALIIATIIVYQQLHYMQNKKLGYDKDQVLYLPDARLLGSNQFAFEQQILKDSRVVSASISRYVPGGIMMDGTEIYPKNETGNGTEIHTNIYHIDYDYLRTLGIRVVQGRDFSKAFSTDSAGVLINEEAARELGWTNSNAVGKTIVRSGQQEYKVVGVVADFNYASVKQKISPMMMMLGNNFGGLIVKINTKDIQGFLGDLKKQWTLFNPDGPLEYNFLDENFAKLYASEEHTQQIFSAFAVLAIIIASLGLFGLSAFVIEQRTKEIGIRKVLGASVKNVLLLVSKEFLLLVMIAFLISIPVTWWAMHTWLQDFAYRIDITAWVFAIAGIAVIFIAFLTISFQAIKAAIANPVKSLRTE
ncbi:FtsX-like permease family protein [Panacibacter ginsenosidivorans]|uniref:FtsX-like permease family protein n=1 Tax=Panacibacter ginsenosidivorans TaxID=1813871 RepID=A0A5B8V5T0_9BACT|nr:ABC transporter permease [Panacibacter ginsenosidivorans]QEC65976.1 FtsX-like permease family protein [Panacibacter ginsenosidivorans]